MANNFSFETINSSLSSIILDEYDAKIKLKQHTFACYIYRHSSFINCASYKNELDTEKSKFACDQLNLDNVVFITLKEVDKMTKCKCQFKENYDFSSSETYELGYLCKYLIDKKLIQNTGYVNSCLNRHYSTYYHSHTPFNIFDYYTKFPNGKPIDIDFKVL